MLFGLFKPYRRGVAAVIVNGDGLLWIGLRHNAPNGANSGFWQFPQGGLNARDEPVEDAARREVREETGMTSLETLKIGDFTTRYRFPKEAVAERRLARRYRGQEHRWALFRFTGPDGEIDLAAGDLEFRDWRWTPPRDALALAWYVRRPSYLTALTAFGLLG